MWKSTQVHHQRDSDAGGEESRPEGASSCTEIGSEDPSGDIGWPVWEIIKTFLFVIAMCVATAAVVAWSV